LITLGSKTLTVGSNSRNARFTGVIDDDFGGGSLTKVGTGKLVLTGQNTYGKSTTVSGGQLIVNNRHGSGTGRSTVSVNAGKLGGTGFISGAVIVGTGNGAVAILSPGPSKAQTGTLTIHRDLTVHSDGTYEFSVNNDTTSADEVVIDGSVTIDSGAKFDASASGTGVLPPGMVFTAVNKTSANPISGRFANLPDGSIVTVGGTNFQANYKGGDGNDLTLTVVP
jgi:autotransporter-associated beta strand protein